MADNSWQIVGNGGTNPASNFVGTTDKQPLVLKAGGSEAMRINPGGSVGVGLTDPRTPLHVLGRISSGKDFTSAGAVTLYPPDGFAWFHMDNGPAGGRPMGRLRFSHGGNPGDHEIMCLLQNGSVGVGLTDPRTPLHVLGRISTGLDFKSAGAVTFYPPDGFAWFHIDNGPAGGRPMGRLRFSHGGSPGDHEIMCLLQNGNVGIGTGTPETTLDVHGNARVTGDILLVNADCAEDFECEAADPGSVMVLDGSGALRQCDREYDKRVAGVISGAGSFKPGIVLDRQRASEGRRPLALVGKTYCKVDCEGAPVETGDLLTTSSTPGHAMKADNPMRAFGSVIGKALAPLRDGRGLIPILVALQ